MVVQDVMVPRVAAAIAPEMAVPVRGTAAPAEMVDRGETAALVVMVDRGEIALAVHLAAPAPVVLLPSCLRSREII